MQAFAGIPMQLLDGLRTKFFCDPKNVVAQIGCTQENPLQIIMKNSARTGNPHIFTNKIELEGKPVTDQKLSGRCWTFSCLNCMRIPFMKANNLEELEFSQNYVYFWDKIERMNFFLHVFVQTAREGHPVNGRVVQHLLNSPADDGGYWDFVVNIIEKYGVIPKSCFPDSWIAENTNELIQFLNSKMREYCLRLRKLVELQATDSELESHIEKMLAEVFHIVSVCLGTPPLEFTWEYQDKSKIYHKIGPISPLDFYVQHIKPLYDLNDKVLLTNDPRPENPYNRLYTVEYMGNMLGGLPLLYINVPTEVLKSVSAASVLGNEAVWFGSDVFKHCSHGDVGVADMEQYDYSLVLGTHLMGMSKAERLQYHDSLETHIMVFTGLSKDDNGKITKWRVENSWGLEGDRGYLMITDAWFDEFVFEVVVDKKFVSPEILKILTKKPTVLPVWDPRASLSRTSTC